MNLFTVAESNCPTISPVEDVTFDATQSAELGDLFKRFLKDNVATGPEEYAEACHWIQRLQTTADSMFEGIRKFRRRMTATDLIQFVLLSDKLKKSSTLNEVVLTTLRLMVPGPVLKAMEEQRVVAAPTGSHISRARLRMDTVHMLWRRGLHGAKRNCKEMTSPAPEPLRT